MPVAYSTSWSDLDYGVLRCAGCIPSPIPRVYVLAGQFLWRADPQGNWASLDKVRPMRGYDRRVYSLIFDDSQRMYVSSEDKGIEVFNASEEDLARESPPFFVLPPSVWTGPLELGRCGTRFLVGVNHKEDAEHGGVLSVLGWRDTRQWEGRRDFANCPEGLRAVVRTVLLLACPGRPLEVLPRFLVTDVILPMVMAPVQSLETDYLRWAWRNPDPSLSVGDRGTSRVRVGTLGTWVTPGPAPPLPLFVRTMWFNQFTRFSFVDDVGFDVRAGGVRRLCFTGDWLGPQKMEHVYFNVPFQGELGPFALEVSRILGDYVYVRPQGLFFSHRSLVSFEPCAAPDALCDDVCSSSCSTGPLETYVSGFRYLATNCDPPLNVIYVSQIAQSPPPRKKLKLHFTETPDATVPNH